jgi:hypothetical protein
MLDGDKEPMKGKTKVFVPQDEKSAAHARRNKKWGR